MEVHFASVTEDMDWPGGRMDRSAVSAERTDVETVDGSRHSTFDVTITLDGRPPAERTEESLTQSAEQISAGAESGAVISVRATSIAVEPWSPS